MGCLIRAHMICHLELAAGLKPNVGIMLVNLRFVQPNQLFSSEELVDAVGSC